MKKKVVAIMMTAAMAASMMMVGCGSSDSSNSAVRKQPLRRLLTATADLTAPVQALRAPLLLCPARMVPVQEELL